MKIKVVLTTIEMDWENTQLLNDRTQLEILMIAINSGMYTTHWYRTDFDETPSPRMDTLKDTLKPEDPNV